MFGCIVEYVCSRIPHPLRSALYVIVFVPKLEVAQLRHLLPLHLFQILQLILETRLPVLLGMVTLLFPPKHFLVNLLEGVGFS